MTPTGGTIPPLTPHRREGDSHCFRIEKREDGTLWSVVHNTFPQVSQFGDEGKEAFLEHPVFSRDYTGQ